MQALLRRFTVILSGEVLQSVFHFGLNLALVRALEPPLYGTFAIIFLIGGIALTFVRAVAGLPALILIPRAVSRHAVAAYSVTFGSGAALLSWLLGLGVTMGLLPWSLPCAVAAGCFVGLWCLRSYVRNMLFARQRAAISGWSDLAFTTSGTILLASLLFNVEHQQLLFGSFVVLALCNGIGIAVALVLLGEKIRIDFRRHVYRRYGLLWRTLAWSVLGVATANLQAQGQTMLVALIAGPAAYAPMAATLVLFAPLRLPAQALSNLIQPEIALSLAKGDQRRALKLIGRATLGLALGAFLYGLIVVLALPFVETHLFAGRFAGEPMMRICLCVWAVVTTSMLYVGRKLLLETIGAFRLLALLALTGALLGLLVVALLLRLASPSWSLLGLLVSEAAVLVGCWHAVGLRGHDHAAATALATGMGRSQSWAAPPRRKAARADASV